MPDPALSAGAPPPPASRRALETRRARRATSGVAAPWWKGRRPKVLALAWTVLIVWWTFWGPDRLPPVVATELTVAPDLLRSRAFTLDALVFDKANGRDDPRVNMPAALVLTLRPDGCDAFTFSPEGAPARTAQGARARLNVTPTWADFARPHPGDPPCQMQVRRPGGSPRSLMPMVKPTAVSSQGSEALWVSLGKPGKGEDPETPLLSFDGVRRLRLVTGPAEVDTKDAGDLPVSSRDLPAALVVEGQGLDVVGAVSLSNGQVRLALRAGARRLTRFEVNGQSRMVCWRVRKASNAVAIVIPSSLVDRALRAFGSTCVDLWAQ